MIKITTAIIAVLVVSIATVSAYAFDEASEPQAIPQNTHADDVVNGYCYHVDFDAGNNNITNNELCVDWGFSSDDTTNTLSIDRTFYRIGDIVEITAGQDYSDTFEATAGYLLIYPQGMYDDIISRYVDNSDNVGTESIIGIVLDENRFTLGCYTINLWYDTPRANEDEAWDEIDFCIVPDYTPSTSTSPPPPPPPTTGISGKVYTDSNDNGTLDSGESGVSGRTVITVNMADFTDTDRTSTDANGDYSFELEVGTYLVQVEGTDAFAYVTIPDGTTITQHFGL